MAVTDHEAVFATRGSEMFGSARSFPQGMRTAPSSLASRPDGGEVGTFVSGPGSLDERHGSSDVLVDARFDQRVRWSPGERLDHLFERKVDELQHSGQSHRLAVDAGEGALTYAELEERANRLARHLTRCGVRSGDRVGLLSDHPLDGYTGMLATLKLNATYVPLTPGFPVDRIAYICRDAGVSTVLTRSLHVETLDAVAATVVVMDAEATAIAAQPSHRLGPEERGLPVDELAYAIYTSGMTGRPKGVAIEHASICNFVQVAAEVYGITNEDRVYQGMTIAFDFSVEEIWVPWMAGATVVPKPQGAALIGQDLHDFLVDRRITGLCCVPTLLATLEDDLPDLRFLLVSGEPCPQDLITRWHRPDLRFVNAYGPPEATVTATWTTLAPFRRVTIGKPLPTYSVVILEPGSCHVVARGGVGEICIGGIGLAAGYLNRPDLTEKAFIDDSIALPNNPSGKIYRTGDLGRIDADGNIEYLGRIDDRAAVRGFRIELTEIESVQMLHTGIATAIVQTSHRQPPWMRPARSPRPPALPSR
jgi:amino acid adenylation domain-containing protein